MMWSRGGGRGDRGGERKFNRSNRGRGGYQKSHFSMGGFRRDGPNFNRNNQNRVNNSTPGRRLGEIELGITEYVNKDVKGFDGIIKARYSDFQVSEIDVQGKIAKLTDISVPSPVKKEKVSIIDEQLDLLEKYNTEILPIELWNQLSKMNQSSDERHPAIQIDVTDKSKEERTKIYSAISEVYGSKILGSTETIKDKKYIFFSKKNQFSKVDTRVKWNYPEDFVHFVVHKENLDTMDAAQIIADALRMHHIKPSFFGYSGTKDRRAKTSQWFSLKKIDPVRISNCAKRLRNIYIGNFEFKNYHLTLGYLKGNVFRIALRNVSENLEVIDNAVESFREHGFLNYYGLQRFGSRADVPTYKIGRHLLRGEFREAIDMILTPQGPFAMQLRCYKETGNASQALSLFPKNVNTIEQKLLMGVSMHAKNDLVTALERLPRNMRLLYIHSFQSWVWNQCVSERIRRHGLNLTIGDLVTENPSLDYDVSEDYFINQWDDGEEVNSKDNIQDEEQHEDEESSNKEESVETIAMGRKRVHRYPKLNKTPGKVRELTEEDMSQGKYTIYNLVLPLPGFDVIYPSNMKDFYDKIMTNEGVDVNVKKKIKSYNLSGTYRKVLIKPQNVSWKHVHYDDPNCDLIQSDWDELKHKNNVKYCDNGKYRALILELTLGSSTYATMALRELLKRDTSSEAQAQKNDYHECVKQSESKDELPKCTLNDSAPETVSIQSTGDKRKHDSENENEEKRIKSTELID